MTNRGGTGTLSDEVADWDDGDSVLRCESARVKAVVDAEIKLRANGGC
jgi:hypothetical protein